MDDHTPGWKTKSGRTEQFSEGYARESRWRIERIYGEREMAFRLYTQGELDAAVRAERLHVLEVTATECKEAREQDQKGRDLAAARHRIDILENDVEALRAGVGETYDIADLRARLAAAEAARDQALAKQDAAATAEMRVYVDKLVAAVSERDDAWDHIHRCQEMLTGCGFGAGPDGDVTMGIGGMYAALETVREMASAARADAQGANREAAVEVDRRAALTESAELRAEVERLRAELDDSTLRASMACESPPERCSCAGCRTADAYMCGPTEGTDP